MLAALAVTSASIAQQATFVNFESPQSHPIDVTPDGSVLVACNTADGVLEVFDLVAGIPQRRGSVAVGVDPVSVRVRGNADHRGHTSSGSDAGCTARPHHVSAHERDGA